MICKGEVKAKAVPVQAYYRPVGFQQVEAPRFHDSPHMKVIKLSTPYTGPLFPRKYSWYGRTTLSAGNTFQDLPLLRETADNTERYM